MALKGGRCTMALREARAVGRSRGGPCSGATFDAAAWLLAVDCGAEQPVPLRPQPAAAAEAARATALAST